LNILLHGAEPEGKQRNLIGLIAAARATLALTRYDMDTMMTQSQRALNFLGPTSPSARASAHWTLGYAYVLRGDRPQARQALLEGISLSKQSGAVFTLILASIGLGNVQEADNQLYAAAETYQSVIRLAGEHPQQIIHEAHLGMARIFYEWNDLDASERHTRISIQLARQYDIQVIDRFILCEVFLARLKLAQGDLAGCEEVLERVERSAHRPSFAHRLPEIAAVRVRPLLLQRKLGQARKVAYSFPLPLSQARVSLAQGNPGEALVLLEGHLRQVEAKGWQDERLKGLVLQALAFQAKGEKNRAVLALGEALKLAEPGGFIRTFLDEGPPMRQLLTESADQGVLPTYLGKLLAAFAAERRTVEDESQPPQLAGWIEPLSQRELEILRLIAQGLSNREISERLFLALITVKVHNQKIFGKLQAKSRTQAVARARDLGLL